MTDSSTVRDDQLVLECFITKCCKDCGEIKAAHDFHRDKRRADGLAFYCRECTRIRSQIQYSKAPEKGRAAALRRRLANPERKRAESAKWRRENRERQSELGARWYKANTDRAREQGRKRYLANKARSHETSRQWRRDNPEAARQIKQRWKQSNKDAVRLHAANRRARQCALTTVPFTAEQLSAKWDYYGRKCWVCGVDAEATDHVKPVAKGGAHMLCNLRPICKSCNSSKRDRWPYPVQGVRMKRIAEIVPNEAVIAGSGISRVSTRFVGSWGTKCVVVPDISGMS